MYLNRTGNRRIFSFATATSQFLSLLDLLMFGELDVEAVVDEEEVTTSCADTVTVFRSAAGDRC